METTPELHSGPHPPAPQPAGGRLHQIVQRAAQRAPTTPAVIDGTGVLTFEELWQSVQGLSSQLARRCAPGDRVAVAADNCLAWVQLSYAVAAAGLVLAPLNQRATPGEQASLVESAGSTVLAGHPAYLAPLGELLAAGRMPTVRTVVSLPEGGAMASLDVAERERSGGAARRGDAGADPSDPSSGWSPHPDLAWLLFSSGTTGDPKGVQLTHAGLEAAAAATLVERPLRPGDVFLTCFSLCHVAAYNVLVTHLAARPVVLQPRFAAGDLARVVHRHGVTMASLAPTMISTLLAHLDAHPDERPLLSSLRAVAYGSSAIGPRLLRRSLDELDVDLYQGYGMTEASGNVAFLGPDDHRRAAGDAPWLLAACGRPSPAVSVSILGAGGDALPAGQPGEIALRGAQVTPGYWRDPEATRAAFTEGWYRTGDIGRFDDDGYLYVIDRARDIVVSGGENIPSRTVEEALLLVDGVRAAAVVGVPDDHWGEAVCACIEVDAGAVVSPSEVRQAVRAHLAGFQVPKHVLVVEELPRNSTGKVTKPALRSWAAATLAERPPPL